jgi:hypothetical protein
MTEVVRGDDLLAATGAQAALAAVLGLPFPRYAHAPLLLDAAARASPSAAATPRWRPQGGRRRPAPGGGGARGVTLGWLAAPAADRPARAAGAVRRDPLAHRSHPLGRRPRRVAPRALKRRWRRAGACGRLPPCVPDRACGRPVPTRSATSSGGVVRPRPQAGRAGPSDPASRRRSDSTPHPPGGAHVPVARCPRPLRPYGGRYVPETLIPALDDLEAAYREARADPAFQAELARVLRDVVGRPSLLTLAERLTAELGGARIYLKREDLNHTGAHKINNTVGQALLARRMGKRRVIAETGAGQHGVATATAAALFGLECVVYMGEEDVRRQQLNVVRMRLLGAEVRPVDQRHAHAQGRHQRGDPRLGDERAHDLLHHRLGRRARTRTR